MLERSQKITNMLTVPGVTGKQSNSMMYLPMAEYDSLTTAPIKLLSYTDSIDASSDDY